MAFASTRDGVSRIWVKQLQGGSSDRSGHLEIWMAGDDGSGARQVTRDGVDAENPTATPDGRFILYTSGNPERLGLWRVRPDGAEDVKWPPSASNQILYGRARWTPDGGRIAFIGADAEGRSGVFVQDFVPGRDTSATRRAVAGFRQSFQSDLGFFSRTSFRRTLCRSSSVLSSSRFGSKRRPPVVFDPNRAASRERRALAGVSLAFLSVLVLGTSAAAPPGAASRPVVAPMPAASAVALDSRTCVEGMSGSFSGYFSEGPEGTDLNGTHNADFALQQRLGDGQRLCARVHGAVRFDEQDGSILELPRGGSVDVETRRGAASQRMLVTEENGQPKHRWWLNDSAHAVDASARAWLGDALAAVNGYRQIGSIQGQVGSLQGEIGSIQGEVGSLQGQIGSIQGEIGSLQGKVGSIQGERGSLQGQIGSHQGAIGGLQGSRWQADAAQRARIDREIEKHKAAIQKLEAEMRARDFPARLGAAEKELDSFDRGEARTRIADLERQIQDLRADERIAALAKEIEDIHAKQRIDEIEHRMKPIVERLKGQVVRLGS